MSRPETRITEGLRDIFDYRNQFDAVLACAFEPEEQGETKFQLYDKIGEVIQSIGKIPYLPHKEIDLKWPNEKICVIPNSIVIPTSDLVICYLGLPSLAGGIMLGSAVKNRIPIIYLYEKKEDFDSLKIRTDMIILGTGIVDRGFKDFRNHTRDLEVDAINISNGLGTLEKCLNRFYQ